MRVYDISQTINTACVFEGDPPTRLEQITSVSEGDQYNVSALSMSLHSGTHIDAPYHLVPSGKRINEIDIEKFIGECRVQAFFEDVMTGEDVDQFFIPGTKRLLIKGYGRTRLSRSAAYALVSEGIELIGIDAPTIGIPEDDYEVHREFLLAGIPIIEGLCLGEPQTGNYTLYAPPIKLSDAEGAPCRALLIK